ncbi:hypothetical protein BFW91_26385 [Pseudomonas fluorescens]|uniref:hypothetical protein n=1 Tax=Pseudomonas fluorescens TaxID=294 RepID=UPI00099BD4CB|nr:hypothetical protein [Pseudomonas fluorescens]OPB02764.1 hypothetical protein BFW91_26385 [Pseudomonas fluorescens]
MIDDDGDYNHDRDDMPEYLIPDQIPQYALGEALKSLTLFNTDMNLVNQAINLTIVDEFVMGLEYDYLRADFNETSTSFDSIFLAAQSQMWIFSVYEVIRTWIQKAKCYLHTAKNSGLNQKLESLKRDRGYVNYTALQKADEVQALIDDPGLLKALEDDLARTNFLFIRLETLRVALAKHEVRKRPKAMMVGCTVGHMNSECGSLEYQMNSGLMIQGNISRRDIADGIRAIPGSTVPTADEVKSYDLFMRGLSDDEALELCRSFEQP